MKLAVVIPCYNEEENIPLVLKRFHEVIGGRKIEVLFVNNGSTDHSARVMDELVPQYPFARSIAVPVNQGYGYGILQGLKSADADYIGWTHADLQTDPADIVKAYALLQKRKQEKIFVKGFRRGRPAFDELFTKGMGLFESIYFGTPLWDINAQPNIFPVDFFNSWINPPYDFALDLYALYMAKRQGVKVVRFAVDFPKRIHGESKWNTDGLKSRWKFIKRTLKFSRELKHSFKEDKGFEKHIFSKTRKEQNEK